MVIVNLLVWGDLRLNIMSKVHTNTLKASLGFLVEEFGKVNVIKLMCES